MTNMKKEYSILVNSCDAYSDVWPLFFEALKFYWPDSKEFNIYLNCESIKKESFFDVNFLNFKHSTEDQWGRRFIEALNRIDDEFVLILLEDYILEDYVDEKKINDALHILKNNSNVGACYLTKSTAKTYKAFDVYRMLEDYEDYRLNTAPALWRKEHLLRFLENIDNPWAWEVFGSYRTFGSGIDFIEPHDDDIYRYASKQGGAIYRGKWVKSVIEKFNDIKKIDIDFEKRGFSNELVYEKRSFKWKLNFIILGYNMVGWKIIYFFKYYIKNKFKAYQ